MYVLLYDCITFTSHVNVLNENTVRTEGIQTVLYWYLYILLDIVVFIKTWYA